MKQHGVVRSVQQPEPKVIDESFVWIAENITQVTEEHTGEQGVGFTGYEYTLTQYNKDEYINMIDEKNKSLETQITDAQVALCELYEQIGE